MDSSPGRDGGKPRIPVLAVLLSLGATGLGQIYCGKLTKGLVLFFLSFAFAPIIVNTAAASSSEWAPVAVILSLALLFSVFLYAMADAYLLAKRERRGYQLKEYNRWYLYLLFVLVSTTYPANLAHTIREQILQAYKIPSASMVPNILPGDYVLLNKTVYRKRSPQIGEIVVFIPPSQRHSRHIKRIAALPGDTVEIKENKLRVNDRPVIFQPAGGIEGLDIRNTFPGKFIGEVNGEASYSIRLAKEPLADFPKTTVPDGHCFLLGDNRPDSRDSRHFGPVPLADVKGRVDFIYYPAVSWKRFGWYRD
ncbi:MAG: signal peptidase I [Thermodesulfobacteriota bacterium]